MLTWQQFAERSAVMAVAGERLFHCGLAMLATTGKHGRPRIHPFVPKIVDGALVAFIIDRSPKRADLERRGDYAIHALPGHEDEEFFIGGRVVNRNHDATLREHADVAMGFFTGTPDHHHVLYEFLIERALWTTWDDFGTANHRPHYRRWHA